MIGTKVVDPLIHCCETCTMPILIYGRMIPCKHVFCFDCAKKAGKHCPRYLAERVVKFQLRDLLNYEIPSSILIQV